MKKQLTHKLIATAAALLTAGLFSTTTAYAEIVTVDSIVYSTSSKTASVIGCDSDVGRFVSIPSTITIEEPSTEEGSDSEEETVSKTYTVTSIGSYAFAYNNSLTSITIPDSVSSIGNNAFLYCFSLNTVSIPNSVRSIGYRAFYNCSDLRRATIPNSISIIEDETFTYCESLSSITVSDSVTSIGNRAFNGCTSLSKINIPNSVKSIGNEAFAGCTSLNSITIPNSVTQLGGGICSSCTSLKSAIIGNGVKTLSSFKDNWNNVHGAFSNCESLTSVTIGNNVKQIGDLAFRNCYSLKKVNIPDSVTSIGKEAFYFCNSLTRITIPDSVTSIGDWAFANCQSLNSIRIPDSVHSIGTYSFTSLLSAKAIYVDKNNPYYKDIDGVLFNKSGSHLYTYPSGRTNFSYTIPNSVTSIGDNSFISCRFLATVSIPNSISSINSNFSYCYSLEWIRFQSQNPPNATLPFIDCPKDLIIYYPEGADEHWIDIYGKHKWYGFETRPWGIVEDYPLTFRVNTENQTAAVIACVPDYQMSISIPSKISFLKDSYKVTSIGSDAFAHCSIFRVNIPESITFIAQGAFAWTMNLKKIEVDKDNPTYITIEDVLFNKDLTLLHTYPANKFGELYTIPITVNTLGKNSFSLCKSLKWIRFQTVLKPSTYDENTFDGCDEKMIIYYPPSAGGIWEPEWQGYETNPWGIVENYPLTYQIDTEEYKTYVIKCDPNYEDEVTISLRIQFTGEFYPVTHIGTNTFRNCALSKLNIPSSVSEIPEGSLAETSNLRWINVNNFFPFNSNYSSAKGVLFGDNGRLLHTYPSGKNKFNYTVPSGVRTIALKAFDGCSMLNWIHFRRPIPPAVHDPAFSKCKSNMIIYYPAGAGELWGSIWHGFETRPWGMISVMNSGLTYEIDPETGTASLTEVDPNLKGSLKIEGFITYNGKQYPLTKIEDYAFQDCTQLTSITFPDSITEIGGWVFYNCENLKWIYFQSMIPPEAEPSSFIGCPEDMIIYYPEGAEENWGTEWMGFKTLPWGTVENYPLTFKINIEEEMATIIDCDTNYNLTINIPPILSFDEKTYLVTTIGTNAFMGCLLTNIIIPENITNIAEGSFAGTSNLLEIILVNDNPSYKVSDGILFSKDGSLLHTYPAGKTNIVYSIPNSVITISSKAFFGCTLLTEIIIPDSVDEIGANAFEECFSLNTIQVDENNPHYMSVDGVLFNKEGTLLHTYPIGKEGSGYIIPKSVSAIGTGAFNGCTTFDWIYFQSQYPPEIGINSFAGFHKEMIIYYPADAKENWESQWHGFSTAPLNSGTAILHQCSTIIDSKTNTESLSLTFVPLPKPMIISGNSNSLNIPSTVTIGKQIYPVTAIADKAFYKCSSLTNIIIPDSVITVGTYAFAYCSSLTSITLGNGTISIGDWAFCNCQLLDSIIIPDSVIEIGDYAFYNCKSLSNVILGNSVQTIGYTAFWLCNKLTEIFIPASVIEIAGSFWSCESLTNIHVDENNLFYKDIDGVLFNKDGTLLITYPAGKSSSCYSVPNFVTEIGRCAFYSCYSLTSISLPDSISIIGDYAFYSCAFLNQMIVPNSVISIGNYAFYWCASLDWIYFLSQTPPEVKTGTFNSCSADMIIYYPEDAGTNWNITWEGFATAPWLSNRVIIDSLIYYLHEDGTAAVIDNLSCFIGSLTIPSSITVDNQTYTVTSIEAGAFAWCTSLSNITIPDSVVFLGEEAFINCSSLEWIYFQSQTPPSIGYNAFLFCPWEMIIYYPKEAEENWNTIWLEFTTESWHHNWIIIDPLTYSINEDGTSSVIKCSSSFSGALSIPSSITVDNQTYAVTSIEAGAFAWCDLLTNVHISNSVSFIGEGAFSYCYSLTEIFISDSVIEIKPQAFTACNSLNNIRVDKNNTVYMDLEGVLFSKDGTLLHIYPAGKTNKSYTLPNSVTSIDHEAFRNCDSLTEIVIPDSVTSIGDYAFYYCTSLTEIILPDSVTSIGSYAFAFCRSLNWIYFQSQIPPKVASNTFNNCPEDMIVYYSSEAEANWKTEWQGFISSSWETAILRHCSAYTDPETGIVSFALTFSIPYINELTNIIISDSGSLFIPESITVEGQSYPVASIGSLAFEDCKSLTEIVIPDSVIQLGGGIFSGCSSLTHVVLGTGITSLPSYANDDGYILGTFSGCYALTEIVIPASVTEIGSHAFDWYGEQYDPILKKIYFQSQTPPITGDDLFGYYPYTYPIVYYPESAETNWKTEWNECTTQPWLGAKTTIDSITYSYGCGKAIILKCNSDFSGSLFLSDLITVEEQSYTLTGIGANAFENCSTLTEIVIPDSVTSIGPRAFTGCSALTSVTIGNGITTIEDYSFYKCKALTTLTLGNSVSHIGNYVFDSCIMLKRIYFQTQTPPDTTYNIFYNCPINMAIYYPFGAEENWGTTWLGYPTQSWFGTKTTVDSITYSYDSGKAIILECAIDLSGSLSLSNSIMIENQSYILTEIGANAFSDCTILTDISIPDSVITIREGAFNNCDSLTNIYVSENNTAYTTLEGILFSKNGTLLHTYPAGKRNPNYSIPNTVSKLEDFSFWNCSFLTEIIIPNSILSIGSYTFNNCESLNWIYFQSQTPPETGYDILYKCPEDMIIYYPAGAETNWGSTWEGFATEAWDPNGIPSLPETVTVGPLTFTLIPGTETYTVSFCIPSYLGKIIIPTLIQIGLTEEYHSEVTPADSLTYPVVSIEPDAFGCTELEEVYFSSSEPPAMEIGTLFEGCSEELVIYYPENTEDNWTPALEGTTIPSQTWDPAVEPAPEQPSLTCGAVSKNPETAEPSPRILRQARSASR